MCNNKVKTQILKWLKRLKNIVQSVYQSRYYLNCRETSIAEFMFFSRDMSVSPAVVYITMDECIYS
jgi:hypothetical protein